MTTTTAARTIIHEIQQARARETATILAIDRAVRPLGFQVVRDAGAAAVTVRARRKPLAKLPRSGALQCPQCPQKFAWAMHLGRHVAARHGGK